MKKILSILAAATLLLQSCIVCTSESMIDSAEFNARIMPISEKTAPCCYLVGDACYLPVTAIYKNADHFELFFYLPRLKSVKVNTGGRTWEPETLYYRLSAADAKLCTGLDLPEVPLNTPPYLTTDEWDATKATRVPLIRKICIDNPDPDYIDATATNRKGVLPINLPAPAPRYSADSIIKYPLAAILFVGVDVPLTVASSIILLPYVIIE